MNLLTRKTATVAVLAVLGLTAGGVAWAESTSTSTVAAASAADGIGKMRGLGRGMLHGEFVMKTRNGFVTVDVARGVVSAVDGNSISVKSADGVVTTFSIGPKTKARSAGRVVALGTVHKGDRVGVFGMKNGSADAVARVIRELPARATQDGVSG